MPKSSGYYEPLAHGQLRVRYQRQISPFIKRQAEGFSHLSFVFTTRLHFPIVVYQYNGEHFWRLESLQAI